LFIAILIFVAYSNTFSVPFQFDDKYVIVNNPLVKNLHNFTKSIKTEGPLKDFINNSRYIGFLTFAVNYKLHDTSVIGYHIFNLSIHIINSLLLYFFVKLSFKTPVLHKSTFVIYSEYVAFFSALIFACHPIQTQAVTYIWQRVTSLATLFYLLSFVMYIKTRLSYNKTLENGSAIKHRTKPVLYYLISLISAVLAMITKEIAFTLPVLIFVYEFMFFKGRVKKRVICLIPLFITLIIIPLSFTGLDKPFGELLGNVDEIMKWKKDIPQKDYFFTQFRVIMTYLRLLFFPINQNIDYDYTLYHSIFDPGVFLSFLFILTIFGSGIYLFYRFRYSAVQIRLISFGIFWFFITLSVESSIIPLRNVIFEHRLYLPLSGMSVAFVTGLFIFTDSLGEKWKNTKLIMAVTLIMIVMTLTSATYLRNNVWKSEISLWEDVVKKSPKKSRGHDNLGVAYQSEGLIDKAIEQYKIALSLEWNYLDTHYNLGTAYRSKGMIDKAIEQFRTALTLQPYDWKIYNALGSVYGIKGLTDKAIENFRIAIKLKPDFASAHYNLGVAYRAKGLIEKANEHFRIAQRVNPSLLRKKDTQN
jgi:Tfp pilus assembly protein PilF